MLTAVSAVFVSALLTRLLTPAEVGAYFLALSIVTVAAMLGRMGLEKTVLQQLALRRGRGDNGGVRGVVRRAFIVAAISVAITGTFVGVLGGEWLATHVFGSGHLAPVASLMAPWTLVLAFEVLFAETFRGLHDIPKASVLGQPTTRLAMVVFLSMLLVLRGEATLKTVLTLVIIAGLLSLAVATWFLRNALKRVPVSAEDSISTSSILRITWPLLISNLTLFAVGHADIWIIGAFRSEAEVAVYGATVRLVMLVGMSLTVVNAVLPPLIGELYIQGRTQRLEAIIRMTASVAALPSALVLLSFIPFGGLVLEATFGPYYRSGATILAILSIGQLVNVWVGSCGYMLIMSGHQRDLMWSAVISGSVGVFGAVAVVGAFGATGVAAAMSSALILQQIMMLLLARRRCGVWTHASLGLLAREAAALSHIGLFTPRGGRE